jgi:hypothetical protein
MDDEAPRLNPSRRATEEAKLQDLMIYGVAFVVNIDGEEWLINPTQVSVYTEPEDEENDEG